MRGLFRVVKTAVLVIAAIWVLSLMLDVGQALFMRLQDMWEGRASDTQVIRPDEPRSAGEAVSGTDRYEAGNREVFTGELAKNPEGNENAYVLDTGDRRIPIETQHGPQFVGSCVRMEVEYTGNGRQFRIMRFEPCE